MFFRHRTTLSGVNWFNRIIDGDDQILIFVTEENMRILANARNWLCDGTFRTVPRYFEQLYTIHCCYYINDNKKFFPMIFALMTSKSQALYRRLFQEIKEIAIRLGINISFFRINIHVYYSESEEDDDEEVDNGIELNCDFCLTDFEIAAVNAIREEFPGVQPKGCHFHLGHNIYRKIQELGLATQFNNDDAFQTNCKMLSALAYLDPNDIPDAFDEVIRHTQLRNYSPELVEYFEHNYIRGN